MHLILEAYLKTTAKAVLPHRPLNERGQSLPPYFAYQAIFFQNVFHNSNCESDFRKKVVFVQNFEPVLLKLKVQFAAQDRESLCVATSRRLFLTAHLFYFTFFLISTKVVMSNSNLQQFYNGGGRGGKIGDFHEGRCRQDRNSRFVPSPSLSFVSWSPQQEEIQQRIESNSWASLLG